MKTQDFNAYTVSQRHPSGIGGYSGAYHERGIAEIKSDIARLANIKPIATLYWYLPLFEVFSVTRK
jgi:hypothetical protein